MKRRILILLCAVCLLCHFALIAAAHEVPDFTHDGEIRITMRDGEVVVPGGTLVVYRVAQITQNNGDYSYAYTDAFSGCDLSLADLQNHEIAQSLADYALANGVTGAEIVLDEAGSATISIPAGELGLYLLVQTQAGEGYAPVKPFLVSVPSYADGKYLYEVDAAPKISLEKAEETEPTTLPTEPETDPDPQLPQTGQLNWPVPVMAISGMILLLTGWLLCDKRKRETDEA